MMGYCQLTKKSQSVLSCHKLCYIYDDENSVTFFYSEIEKCWIAVVSNGKITVNGIPLSSSTTAQNRCLPKEICPKYSTNEPGMRSSRENGYCEKFFSESEYNSKTIGKHSSRETSSRYPNQAERSVSGEMSSHRRTFLSNGESNAHNKGNMNGEINNHCKNGPGYEANNRHKNQTERSYVIENMAEITLGSHSFTFYNTIHSKGMSKLLVENLLKSKNKALKIETVMKIVQNNCDSYKDCYFVLDCIRKNPIFSCKRDELVLNIQVLYDFLKENICVLKSSLEFELENGFHSKNMGKFFNINRIWSDSEFGIAVNKNPSPSANNSWPSVGLLEYYLRGHLPQKIENLACNRDSNSKSCRYINPYIIPTFSSSVDSGEECNQSFKHSDYKANYTVEFGGAESSSEDYSKYFHLKNGEDGAHNSGHGSKLLDRCPAHDNRDWRGTFLAHNGEDSYISDSCEHSTQQSHWNIEGNSSKEDQWDRFPGRCTVHWDSDGNSSRPDQRSRSPDRRMLHINEPPQRSDQRNKSIDRSMSHGSSTFHNNCMFRSTTNDTGRLPCCNGVRPLEVSRSSIDHDSTNVSPFYGCMRPSDVTKVSDSSSSQHDRISSGNPDAPDRYIPSFEWYQSSSEKRRQEHPSDHKRYRYRFEFEVRPVIESSDRANSTSARNVSPHSDTEIENGLSSKHPKNFSSCAEDGFACEKDANHKKAKPVLKPKECFCHCDCKINKP